MGMMIIDGRRVPFTDEKNVLTVIRRAGIYVPTLCYHPSLSTFGACRLCTVEDDHGKLFASCSERPRDGMKIFTNTPRLNKYRREIIELLLASHDRDCTTCPKNQSCELLGLAQRYGISEIRFDNYREKYDRDDTCKAIVRDPNKCILCGNCVRVCKEIQSVGAIDFAFRGSSAQVMPAFNKGLGETNCVGCGQCRVYCPTGAITIHRSNNDVWDYLSDPDVRVVAQIAPAVRVAIGDYFGMKAGENVFGYLVAALHRIGFDEVYDTAFGADLTVMEESREFVERLKNGGKLPLFTSCCPAWVNFVGNEYPEMTENVSTCRSPEGMLSAVVKEYYRNPENNPDNKKTIMVSIMPCTAKKIEIDRPNCYTKGEKDTDVVLTTTELINMLRTVGIDFQNIEPEAADIPFGFGSGGGVIFGTTGGVAEAVIRRLTKGHSREILDEISESGVRGTEGIREFTAEYDGQTLNICVASGLANAREVMRRIESGEKQYHLVEVMACPGGCVMGGGQPRRDHDNTWEIRRNGLYETDRLSATRKCNDNPMIEALYQGVLKGKEHELLHNEEFCAK